MSLPWWLLGLGAPSSADTGIAQLTGTATALFAGASDVTVDAALNATGTGTVLFVSDAPAVVDQPAQTGGGSFPGAWSTSKKKKKKPKRDELEELISHLREHVVPYREAESVAQQIVLRKELEQALTVSQSGTLDEIESEIGALKEILDEIDEEEALLLLV